MTVVISARHSGILVREGMARSQEEADRLFAMIERAHPDCEITMRNGDHILLSTGPRSCRGPT